MKLHGASPNYQRKKMSIIVVVGQLFSDKGALVSQIIHKRQLVICFPVRSVTQQIYRHSRLDGTFAASGLFYASPLTHQLLSLHFVKLLG